MKPQDSYISDMITQSSATESYFHDGDSFVEDTADINLQRFFNSHITDTRFNKVWAIAAPNAELRLFVGSYDFNVYDRSFDLALANAVDNFIKSYNLGDDFQVTIYAGNSELADFGAAREFIEKLTQQDAERSKTMLPNIIDTVDKKFIQLAQHDPRNINLLGKCLSSKKAFVQISGELTADDVAEAAKVYSKLLQEETELLGYEEEFEVTFYSGDIETKHIYFIYYDGAFCYITKKSSKSVKKISDKLSVTQQLRNLRSVLGEDYFESMKSSFYADLPYFSIVSRLLHKSKTKKSAEDCRWANILVDAEKQSANQIMLAIRDLYINEELSGDLPVALYADYGDSMTVFVFFAQDVPSYIIYGGMPEATFSKEGFNKDSTGDVIEDIEVSFSDTQFPCTVTIYSTDKLSTRHLSFSATHMIDKAMNNRTMDTVLCLDFDWADDDIENPDNLTERINELQDILENIPVNNLPRYFAIADIDGNTQKTTVVYFDKMSNIV
ncbi:MAG: hypothetical protein NC218_02430 [Acetobacter sp.]|nr:hypothetical protein [Acetobacter sp.]